LKLFTVPGFKPQPQAPAQPQAPRPAAPPAVSSEQGQQPARAAGPGPAGVQNAGGAPAAAGAPAQGRGGRGRPAAGVTQVDTGPRLSAKERAERNKIDETWDVRVRVKAGERQLNVAFLKLDAAIDETPRLPFIRPFAANVNTPDNRMGVALRSVEIVGPYNPSGPGLSASRQRIFVCQPAAPKPGEGGPASAKLSDAGCA